METVDTSKILDATLIEPRFKHTTIIDRFLGLKNEAYFILKNDHDPVPLYYQFQAEYPDTFKWEYLQKGPEFWEVKITKTGSDLSANEPTVGELVAEDYRKAEVFRKFGIDFCCNGQKSVKEACVIANADYSLVMNDINKITNNSTDKVDKFNKWELDFLADYIVANHHAYVRENVQMLFDITEKIATVHGSNHPELIEIATKFRNIATLLLSHMEKEEKTLFPYIKTLVQAKKNGTKVAPPAFETIQHPIDKMEEEHEATGDEMEEIRKLSNDFLVPTDGCNTYRLTFAKLEEFEKDLHQHVHLENNILFVKAINLEKEVLA